MDERLFEQIYNACNPQQETEEIIDLNKNAEERREEMTSSEEKTTN